MAAAGERPVARLDLGHYAATSPRSPSAASSTRSSSPTARRCAGNRRVTARPAQLEPLTLLTALAAATEHDRADRHRVHRPTTSRTTWPAGSPRSTTSAAAGPGWNIVTTAGADAARNFGLDDQPGARRRATSGPPSSSTSPRSSGTAGRTTRSSPTRRPGVYADPARIHPIDHRGHALPGRGPLNVPRSPQGHPLLVQAGSSRGRQGLRGPLRRGDLHRAADPRRRRRRSTPTSSARGAAAGRDPDRIKILPGHRAGHRRRPRRRRSALERRARRADRPEYGLAPAGRACSRSTRTGLELDGPLPADLPAEDEIEGAQEPLRR